MKQQVYNIRLSKLFNSFCPLYSVCFFYFITKRCSRQGCVCTHERGVAAQKAIIKSEQQDAVGILMLATERACVVAFFIDWRSKAIAVLRKQHENAVFKSTIKYISTFLITYYNKIKINLEISNNIIKYIKIYTIKYFITLAATSKALPLTKT